MGHWEERYLGRARLPSDLSEFDIERFCRLDETDISAIMRRRRDLNRLAFAVQLVFMRHTGRPLNSPQLVPRGILEKLALQLDVACPDLASIRSLYGRKKTLFDHQRAAMCILGLRRPNKSALGHLSAYLRKEAYLVYDNGALVQRSMRWLSRNKYTLPGDYVLLLMSREARNVAEASVAEHVHQALNVDTARSLLSRLASTWEGTGVPLMEYLQTVPAGRTVKGVEVQAEKVRILRDLGADRLDLPMLPESALRFYAARMSGRSAKKLTRIKEPRASLELGCFLRLTLLKLSDQVARMADHRIAAFWREAHSSVLDEDAKLLTRYQQLVETLEGVVSVNPLNEVEAVREIQTLLRAFNHKAVGSRTTRTRRALTKQHRSLRRIVNAVREMDLSILPDHSMEKAFACLDGKADAVDLLSGLGRVWTEVSDSTDPKSLQAAAVTAAALLLKRSLKNGSVSVPHSLDHRSPEDRLIPKSLWLRDRGRFIRDLDVPEKAGAFLGPLTDRLHAGLAGIEEALDNKMLRLENDRLVLPRSKLDGPDPAVDTTRRHLMDQVGEAQLPDILVEIDAYTQFSWTLLGRPPRSDQELITVYAAVLALGSDLTPAAIGRMVAGVKPVVIGRMMHQLIAGNALRNASDTVCGFMRSQAITSHWGDGLTASSDNMSLEASRHLWATRTDPRRRTFAVGSYTHVLDQWGIAYDQPVVLNMRQAGAAIEGALRQTTAPELFQLCVDTHGHTHFAMALAKLCRLDLCARLARLSSRKLYVPKGFNGPERLRPVLSPTISERRIAQGWDPLLRLAASVKDGWCPATFALEKLGSAAKGGILYEAGVALGKLLGTLYLCDYLTNADFRRTIGRSLAQGEAVHTLQRAIYNRPLGAKEGRDAGELAAISAALTLITNIVMAWNTNRMQRAIDQSPSDFSSVHLRHIAPIAHAHINMRGMMTFNLGQHRTTLIPGAQSKNKSAA